MTQSKLVQDFNNKSVRALGRLISMGENHDPTIYSCLKELYQKTGKAQILGITGPPGAGKSTLCSAFVQLLRKQKKTVAVLSVDPVSPFSGGSLLGDRIRLSDHFNDEGVFIRSLSTRGKLGGLSLATRQAIHLTDAFGFDTVLIETVGVGQNEIDVHKMADVTLLVLVPEWGDAIQTLKAGIIEIADLFVVNKSDRPGADKLVTELRETLDIAKRKDPLVFSTSNEEPSSVQKLFDSTQDFLNTHRSVVTQRRQVAKKETLVELLEREVADQLKAWVDKESQSNENPYQVISQFLTKNASIFSQ